MVNPPSCRGYTFEPSNKNKPMNSSKAYKTLRYLSVKLINNYGLDIVIGFVLASIFILMVSFEATAQNIGVNNPAPNAKALLDLTSTTKGLLTPRMLQAERLAMFPAPDATAKGMLVYQTDLMQGFYYYDGAVWHSVADGAAGWGLTGNAGTSPATNYMGSSDSISVILKSHNKEVLRMTPAQKVGIGTTNPGAGYPSVRFEVADETGANSDVAIRSAGGGMPQLILESSNGTLAAPAQSNSNAWGGAIIGQVYDGTQFTNTSALIFGTEGVNSAGNVSGTIQFNTNKIGALGWEKMRLTSNGNLSIGVANPLNRLDVAGNTNVIADSNYRIGNVRVLSTKGAANLFTGSNAGINNQSGAWNTFIGTQSGMVTTTGSENTFLGGNSGYLNTIGASNMFAGAGAGYKNTTGSFNSYFGRSSGGNATTANNNTFIGYLSGTLTTIGSNNTYVGYNARGAAALNNSAAFGNNAFVGLDNSMVLGDTSVKVGIGNSYPDFPLSFQNKVGDKICLWGSTGNIYGMGIQASLMQFYVPNSNSDMAFGFGGSATFSEKVRIKGNGRMGVGTSTPGNRTPNTLFEIADSTGTNRHLVISTTNNTNYHQVLAFARTRGTYSSPAIVQNSDNLGRLSGTAYDGANMLTASEIQYHVDSIPGLNSMPGNMTFHTNPGFSVSYCAERMRIDRNGNVGINTTTPTAKLDVNGTFKLTDGTQGLGKLLVSDAAGKASWQNMEAGNINGWSMGGNAGTNPLTNYIGTSDATDLMIRTNGTARMTFASTGNIGVGMNPLPGAKLSIYNNAGEGININGGTMYNGLSAYVNGVGFVNAGVLGQNIGMGCGVQGLSSAASGYAIGVRGAAFGATSTGVEGQVSDATGVNYGVKGITASPAGYSGHFSGGKFYVSGNAGFGTIVPNTQVEINGGLSLVEDASLVASTASFTITVGNRSYIRINSNSTPANRLITLSNGLRTGQLLILESTATGGVNGVRLSDVPATYNTNLATFHDMYENDVITLIWNGTDWIETAYSNN